MSTEQGAGRQITHRIAGWTMLAIALVFPLTFGVNLRLQVWLGHEGGGGDSQLAVYIESVALSSVLLLLTGTARLMSGLAKTDDIPCWVRSLRSVLEFLGSAIVLGVMVLVTGWAYS